MAPNFVRRRMSRIAFAAAGLVLGGMVAFQPVQIAQAQGPVSVADLAENLADAVVNISTAQTVQGRRSVPMPQVPDGSPFQEFFEEFFNRQNRDNEQAPRRVQSLGSGFVIDGTEGIIITNNHVIEGADEITANFNDGTKLRAEIIGTDEKTDLAVLKVEPETPLKAVDFGDSETIRVGDWVMAIGNPFGLGGTVTVGIVSARNRDINSGPYDNFIQTDASINRGNSGGPLFDMQGNVIGINTAIISPSGGSIGIGFAIPAKTAMRVIDQLREFGETRRGWLGVRIQDVTPDMVDAIEGLAEARGALVTDVPAGPAEDAGMLSGDVITVFDGVAIENTRELVRIVGNSPVGKEVPVTVLRNGDESDLIVVLGRRETSEAVAFPEETPEEEAPAEANILGLTLAPITDELTEQFSLSSDEGLVITGIDPESEAASKGLVEGDLITEAGQQKVGSVEDFEARITEARDAGRKSLLLLVRRGGDPRFVALSLEEAEE